jgi:chloramphenicol-sensitive protein RarD
VTRVDDTRRGIAYGLSAFVLWGFLTVYWKQLSGLSAFELIGQRILWSAAVLTLILSVSRNWRWIGGVVRQPALLARIAAAAMLLATNWISYVWCVTHDNVIETALGYFIAPLGTVLIGVTVLGERMRRPQLVALALAGLAVVVLTVDYGRVPWFALVLGATWAVYGLLKRLVPLSAVQGLASETFVLLPVAVLLVLAGEAAGDGLVGQASTLQLVLVALSGVVTTVPLLLFAAAAKRVPFTTLGPLQYAVPTINFVLGVLVYDEAMPAWRLMGFVLVWVALAMVTVDGLRAARDNRAVAGRTLTPVEA